MFMPVLLAGGEGKRLWPLSNSRVPKQFLATPDGSSFFQNTIQRVTLHPDVHGIITVASEAMFCTAEAQFTPFSTRLTQHLITEPMARNTAAAVVLAALYAEERLGNPVLWFVPSDHAVKHPNPLIRAVDRAIPLAQQGHIVTFGIHPTRADKHYGYIVKGQKKAEGVFAVNRFLEKPAPAIAERLIRQGACFWNSGMFVATAKTILEETKRHHRPLVEAMRSVFRYAKRHAPGLEVRHGYEAVPALPIDKALMERTRKLRLIPVDIGWTDIGSWQSLWEFTREGMNDNSDDGECGNCLAYLNRRLSGQNV